MTREAFAVYLEHLSPDGILAINFELDTFEMAPLHRGLAAEFGCDAEEIAITRNASESLQILQNGLDLAVCITEGIPVIDMARALRNCSGDTRIR